MELALVYGVRVLRPPLPPLYQPRRLKVEIESIEVDDEAIDRLTDRTATTSPVAVPVSLEQQRRHLEVPLGRAFPPPAAQADFEIDVRKAPPGGDAPDIDLRVHTELTRQGSSTPELPKEKPRPVPEPTRAPRRSLSVHRSFDESNGWGATAGTTATDRATEGGLNVRYRVEVEPLPSAHDRGPAAVRSRGTGRG